MRPIPKNKTDFYRAVKTYFDVKHNFDGWFKGKVKEPILDLVIECAKKEDPNAGIAIMPGLIIATVHGVTREYTEKNWWRGKITGRKNAIKKPSVPRPKAVPVQVVIKEYERGWGNKVISSLSFKNRRLAENYVTNYNAKNNSETVPDQYFIAEIV